MSSPRVPSAPLPSTSAHYHNTAHLAPRAPVIATPNFQELSLKLDEFTRVLKYPSADTFAEQNHSSVDDALRKILQQTPHLYGDLDITNVLSCLLRQLPVERVKYAFTRWIVANPDRDSLKSLRTFIWECLSCPGIFSRPATSMKLSLRFGSSLPWMHNPSPIPL